MTPRRRPPLSGMVDLWSCSINRKFLTRGLQGEGFVPAAEISAARQSGTKTRFALCPAMIVPEISCGR
jgi:hypothetical protein